MIIIFIIIIWHAMIGIIWKDNEEAGYGRGAPPTIIRSEMIGIIWKDNEEADHGIGASPTIIRSENSFQIPCGQFYYQ